MDWAIELKLHTHLSKLLRFAALYSSQTHINSCTNSYSSGGGSGAAGEVSGGSGGWVPSNGMLAAAIYSLCCAFTHNHAHAKQCLASTGEAAAAVLKVSSNNNNNSLSMAAVSTNATSASTSGTSLHLLVALGLSRNVAPVARWLSLGIAGSLLSSARNLGELMMK